MNNNLENNNHMQIEKKYYKQEPNLKRQLKKAYLYQFITKIPREKKNTLYETLNKFNKP